MLPCIDVVGKIKKKDLDLKFSKVLFTCSQKWFTYDSLIKGGSQTYFRPTKISKFEF